MNNLINIYLQGDTEHGARIGRMQPMIFPNWYYQRISIYSLLAREAKEKWAWSLSDVDF